MAGTKRIQNFLNHLVLRKIRVNVLTFRSKREQPAPAGEYRSVPYRNIATGVDMKLRNIHKIILYYLRGIKAISGYKMKNSSNIVYNSGGINIENLLFILWAKISGFKIILAIEEDYTFFRDDVKLISRFKFWTIRRLDFLNCRWADAIVVLSTYLLEKYKKMKAGRVVLIPIAAGSNRNEKKLRLNSPLKIIYAGTFADKDGVSDIIEGFLAFNATCPDSKLVLTGKSEQQQVYLKKFGDDKRLIFTGFVPDDEFYTIMRDADILCMCRTESGFANAGFPFKLGEYLATGNPVVCTRVSDVTKYLTSEDAFLIDPGRPDQICDAFRKIADDPDGARIIGMNGFNKCLEHFSPEKNGEMLLELMKTI